MGCVCVYRGWKEAGEHPHYENSLTIQQKNKNTIYVLKENNKMNHLLELKI